MSEWRPIETAEKVFGGPRILASISGFVAPVRWYALAEDGDEDGEGWVFDDGIDVGLRGEITHWRPLPEPPDGEP